MELIEEEEVLLPVQLNPVGSGENVAVPGTRLKRNADQAGS